MGLGFVDTSLVHIADPRRGSRMTSWIFEGFARPTPVQSATIPLFLSHKDVVVEAVTGSGKTLAFLLPVMEILMKRSPTLDKNEVGAIIISPTRELAKQIFEILKTFLESLPLKAIMLVGGRDVSVDLLRLKDGCNIIVATPGRLLDILERNQIEKCQVKTLEVLIMDEADRLLDLGFEKAITTILERLPKQRRTGLFSATMSSALSQLIRTGLRNPVRVTVRVENVETKNEQRVPTTLCSYYSICDYEYRLAFLSEYIKHKRIKKTIVYFGTCASVDYFNRAVPILRPSRLGVFPKLFAIHGKMSQTKRMRTHQEFQGATSAILLCTDLAARGLDFQDVDLVIQYEAPQDPTTFVHRCGRTARNGRSGQALLLLSESEGAYIDFLHNRQIPIDVLPQDPDMEGAAGSFSKDLRQLNAGDRDLHEHSVKAFVAFIRFYQEHQAKFIFRLKEVNIAQVANSFGLLRLPKVSELKGVSCEGFVESSVNISEIKFKDHHRNIQRQKAFETLKKLKNDPHTKSRRIKRPETALSILSAKRLAAPIKNELDYNELEDDWKEYKESKRLSK